jgi:hypothetical protein
MRSELLEFFPSIPAGMKSLWQDWLAAIFLPGREENKKPWQ